MKTNDKGLIKNSNSGMTLDENNIIKRLNKISEINDNMTKNIDKIIKLLSECIISIIQIDKLIAACGMQDTQNE